MTDPTTGWATWNGHFVYDGKPLRFACNIWKADNYVEGKTLTIYPGTDWKTAVEIPNFRTRWSKHGHNWRDTTRLDFHFSPPFDPYEWHGHLITGGLADTFRVRRCVTRDIFRRITNFLPRPREITRETIGTLPVWRARYHRHPDAWAARQGCGKWGLLDWCVARDPDDLIRQIVLRRLRLVA